QDQRRPAFLSAQPRNQAGRRREHDRQRFLQSRVQRIADGICCRSTETAWHQPRGRGGLNPSRRLNFRNNDMLEIKDLHAEINGTEILRGLDLVVRPGEMHAIMGPNGSGKSTLSHVLAGRDGYTVTSGSVTFNGKSLLDLSPEDRAGEGLFLAF